MGVGTNIVEMSTRPGSFVEEVRGPGPGKEGWLAQAGGYSSLDSLGGFRRRHGATKPYEGSGVDIPATLQGTYGGGVC